MTGVYAPLSSYDGTAYHGPNGLAQNASAKTVIDAVPYTIASPGVYELGKNLTFPSTLET
jgi:hypothetical protein